MGVYSTMVQAMIVRKINVIANDEYEAVCKAEQIFRNDLSDGITYLALMVEGELELQGLEARRHPFSETTDGYPVDHADPFDP